MVQEMGDGKTGYPTLVRDSKNSQSSLQRLFRQYLQSAPAVKIKSKSRVHLLLTGPTFPMDCA